MPMITVQLTPDSPITEMDLADLVRVDGMLDNEVEHTTWVEYRLKSDPNNPWAVHRSVDMILKQPAVSAEGVAASFG